jgi:hypothetical protein
VAALLNRTQAGLRAASGEPFRFKPKTGDLGLRKTDRF